MKIPAARASEFAKSAWRSARGVLFYGPDAGLARERAEAAISLALGAHDRHFSVSEVTGAGLKDDRRVLADELAMVPFGGGPRIVRVRDASEGAVDALELALTRWPEAGHLVVEAGELSPRSGLRRIFEEDERLAAVPCYADTPEAIGDLVRSSLAAEKIAVSSEALDFLASRLGGDRLAVRGEIAKLAVYGASTGTIDLEDALACAGAWGESSLDEALHAACSGEVERLDARLNECVAEGVPSIAMLRGAMRHVERLMLARIRVDGGASVEDVVRQQRPPIFFRHVEAFKRQLRIWSAGALRRALSRLMEAEIRCKAAAVPDEAIGGRAFYELAMGARRETARR